MGALKLQFIKDEKGKKVAVLLPIDDYNSMLEQFEELEEIKAYDVAEASDDEVIPFEQAIKEIESKRYDL